MTDKKAKKTTTPDHPKFREMIKAALESSQERSGVSRIAIGKYILANYNVENSSSFTSILRRTLKNAVLSGVITQTKGIGASGSFKLAKVTKKPAAKKLAVKKPAAKKPAAKKPAAKKPAAKKPAAKKPVKKVSKPKSPKKATKKPAPKKTPKKVVAKKPAPKKAAKKPAAKKTAAKK